MLRTAAKPLLSLNILNCFNLERWIKFRKNYSNLFVSEKESLDCRYFAAATSKSKSLRSRRLGGMNRAVGRKAKYLRNGASISNGDAIKYECHLFF